jgi:hypothetical protein
VRPLSFCALLVLAVILSRGTAVAGPSTTRTFPITIVSDDPPDVVCVLAHAPSKDALTYDDVVTEAEAGESKHGAFKKDKEALNTFSMPPPPDYQRKPGEWNAIVSQQRAALEQAWGIVPATPATPAKKPEGVPACTSPGRGCDASVPAPAGNWKAMLCEGAPVPKTVPRLAVLGIDFKGEDKALLKHIYFDGRVVMADFEAPWEGAPIFTVQGLGGSYKPAPPRLGAQLGTEAVLVPSCMTSTVRLPRLAHESKGGTSNAAPASPPLPPTLSVKLPDGGVCTATPSPEGELDVSLPVKDEDGQGSSLHVTLDDGGRKSEFDGAWATRVPPRVILTSVATVSFQWQPDCLYGAQECPVVEFPDVGTTCPGVRTETGGACNYSSCVLAATRDPSASSSGVAVGVSFPISVVFRAGNVVWPDRLVAVGQTTHGFVPPDRYQIQVDTSKWSDMPPGDDVGWIALTTPDGATHRVELHSQQSPFTVALPGIHCPDKLVMRGYGQRRYDDDPLTISNYITLPRPEHKAHRLSLGIDGAIVWVLPAALTGLQGDVGALWGKFVGFQAGGWLAWRPARSSLSFEFQADFVYADRTLLAPHAPSESSVISTHYYRAPLVLTAGRSLTENISVGAGAGIVVGGPFYDNNGIGFDHTEVTTTIVAYGRYALGRDVALEFRTAVLLAEKAPAYDTDFKGGVYSQTGELTSVLLSLGLRGNLASGPFLKVDP